MLKQIQITKTPPLGGAQGQAHLLVVFWLVVHDLYRILSTLGSYFYRIPIYIVQTYLPLGTGHCKDLKIVCLVSLSEHLWPVVCF